MHKHIILFIIMALTGGVGAGASNDDFIHLPAKDYPVGESLPRFSHIVSVGTVGMGQQYNVSIEYPEYEVLSQSEIRLLGEWKDLCPETPEITTSLGISRREGLLEISFIPIVRKAGRWMRITSCKLNIQPRAMAQAATGTKATTASRYASTSVLASGRWVKIRVKEEGIYQLTRDQLQKMGFNNMNQVKVYGCGGLVQNEKLAFSGTDLVADDLEEVPLFRKEDALCFFAEGTVSWSYQSNLKRWAHTNNPYSSYSYYFVTEGDNPLQISRLVPPSGTVQEEVSSVLHHAVYENDVFGWYEGGRRLYDSYDFAYGNTHSYKVSTPDYETGTAATVEVAFGAAGATNTRADFSLAGSALGTVTVTKYDSKNENAREATGTFNAASLAEENTISITSTAGNPARLNYIRINYQRTLNAAANPYVFSAIQHSGKCVQLALANATSTMHLWRIGSAGTPLAEVQSSIEDGRLLAMTDIPESRFIVFDEARTYDTPEVVGEVVNQNLHGDTAADMVIIVPASGKYSTQAERLAQLHREYDGMRVRIVRADEIYNEFSSGTPDATAYRRYLKMLYDRADNLEDAPRYLLLFGAGAWDNRMLTDEWKGQKPEDYLLVYEVDGSTQSIGTVYSYVTDDYFALLDDGEGANIRTEKMDIAVGRLTPFSEEEADILVNKIERYLKNEDAGAWKNTMCIMGDYGDSNEHMIDAENVATLLTNESSNSLNIKKIYWDAYDRTSTATGFSFPQVTKMIKEQLDKGTAMINYSGHGSPTQISKANLLKMDDFRSMTSTHMTHWVLAACEIYPIDSREENLGQVAMLDEKGGAIAFMCATRSVYAAPNNLLNQDYCKYLVANDEKGRRISMGEALRLAKCWLIDKGYSSNASDRAQGDLTMNKLKYVLVGDPALVLAIPTGKMVLDSINGSPLTTSGKVQLKAGSVARFSGYIDNGSGQPDETFNGTATATLLDRTETITCKNNNGDNTSPFVYEERSKTIYEGSNDVANGRFTFNVPIPIDISYTNDSGRLSLYAIDETHERECAGYSEQLFLNGTDETAETDTVGPKILAYLDYADFPDGGIVGTNATFIAHISDNAGINASGLSLGHDMELVIDDNATGSIILNDYFSYDYNSYQSGQLIYPMTELTPGAHHLTFRVWDVNNNPASTRINFNVRNDVEEIGITATCNPATTNTTFVTNFGATNGEDAQIRIEVYDVAGRLVWSKEEEVASYERGCAVTPWNLRTNGGAPLNAGIYVYRAIVTMPSRKIETDAKKIIITKQ